MVALMFDEWCDRQRWQWRWYNKIGCTLSQLFQVFSYLRDVKLQRSNLCVVLYLVSCCFLLWPIGVIVRASVHYLRTKFFASLLNFLMISVWHACTMWFYYFVHDSSKSRLPEHRERTSHTVSICREILNSCMHRIYVFPV